VCDSLKPMFIKRLQRDSFQTPLSVSYMQLGKKGWSATLESLRSTGLGALLRNYFEKPKITLESAVLKHLQSGETTIKLSYIIVIFIEDYIRNNESRILDKFFSLNSELYI